MLLKRKLKFMIAFATAAIVMSSSFLVSGIAKPVEGLTLNAADKQLAVIRDTMESEEYSKNAVIVVIKPAYSKLDAQYGTKDFKELDIKEVKNLTYINKGESSALASADYRTILSLTLNTNSDEEMIQAIKALLMRSDVENAYLDIQMELSAQPNDTHYSTQWGLQKINAPNAWDIESGNPGVRVGVIDTGVDYTHEDLAANIWTNTGEIAGDGIDNDGNGYVDDIHGWNFTDNNNDVSDISWHGTAVASVIGAVSDNNIGIAGVAPNVSIVPLKAGKVSKDEVSLDISAVINAITYCIKNDIEIINYSAESTEALNVAIQNYKGLFVTAAGNSGENNDSFNAYPVTSDFENVIKVAATVENDSLLSLSNYGKTDVAVAAPGRNISVAVPENYSDESNYVSNATGTSFASPFAAGTAALLKSYNPDLTPAQIIDALVNSSDKVSELNGKVASGGRLNAQAALEYVKVEEEEVAVDKTFLQARVDSLVSVENTGYTDASWNAFETALSNANLVLENEHATQTQVNAALQQLNGTYSSLTAAAAINSDIIEVSEVVELNPADISSGADDSAGASSKAVSKTSSNNSSNPKTSDNTPLMVVFIVFITGSVSIWGIKRKSQK